jgi:membrane protease YdiL (CAAX protease family)
LPPPAGQFKRLGGGLLLGFGSLALLALLALGGHQRALVHVLSPGKIAGTLLGAAGTAVLVAVPEEILFRGGVFGGLRRILHWTLALGVSSAVYALVHFLNRVELAGPVHWNSGLLLLPQMLAGFMNLRQLVPGFFNLTLAGVLLGLAYHRTGNLYFSIGLHAGWVFWLKIYAVFTTAVRPEVNWFWGTGKMIDGWLACLVLAAALGVLKMWPLESGPLPRARP